MTLHKLSAGGGYTYLTRQVARLDAQGVRGAALGGYYSGQGETPGRWLGSGLPGLGEAPGLAPISTGDVVTEDQMRALFGQGRHPLDEIIRRRELAAGAKTRAAERAGRLGRAFPTLEPLSDFRTRCATEYEAAGCLEATPAHEQARAAIRTAVATRMFTAELGRAPVDGRELNGFIIRATRRSTPVAGYDLTFSPVKSVSALWALAPVPVARQIEAAHGAAVADTLAWLEAEAVFTRQGRAGVRQVRTCGLLATAFVHRDSRSGDPDLHTHVAISNKVRTLTKTLGGTAGSGPAQWLAIDGRVLHKAAVAASERYNTALEAELRARLGVSFAERTQPDPRKRPVREIVGIPAQLLAAWSSRRAAIDVARADLERAFQARHGRPPTPAESIKLAQQANLDTRAAKHEPRSEAEQRTQWRAEAITCLAGPPAPPAAAGRPRSSSEAVRRAEFLVDRLLNTARAYPAPTSQAVTQQWVQDTAHRVVATTAATRATWQQWHLMAETRRAVRSANIAPDQQQEAYARVLAVTLGPTGSVPLTPADSVAEPRALRRPPTPDTTRHQGDNAAAGGRVVGRAVGGVGQSVYEVAGMTFYSSPQVLAAEQRVLAIAEQAGAHRVGDTEVDLALLESAANGRTLNPAQAVMVRQLATSGARLQLAIAPAGSGKTTATSVLARAWENGGGTVIGLCPTAAAASVLADQTGTTCDTLAKLVHTLTQPRGVLPGWARDVGPRTLVILDEAGMASTADLDVALGWLAGRSAVIRLIGDDQQLASVASGGLLRDIATAHGAVTLSELMRFTIPAEANATVALRAGDATAIGFWLDHDRVAVGGAQTMIEATYQQWAADRAAGIDSIMLVPRRDIVATLNAAARTDRLTRQGHDQQHEVGREMRLPDGNLASAGDTVITRRNARNLPTSARDYVRNGYRWTIQTVHHDGSLTVRSARPTPGSGGSGGSAAVVRLPAGYVREHVELGYATTIHTAQGVTADRCRLLADDTLDRQLLYVGTTRGRHTNTINLIVVGDGDPHDQTSPDAVRPQTATEILEAIVARDGSQVSATTRARQNALPTTQLAGAAALYHDALGVAAQAIAGPVVMDHLDQQVTARHPQVRDDPAYSVLRARLALLHLQGTDPLTALVAAVGGHDLSTARDLAAVLEYRLHTLTRHERQQVEETAVGPLPWLPGISARVDAHTQWGPYLRARHHRVHNLTAQVLAGVQDWTPDTAPAWVGTLGLAHDDPLTARLAVWRYAHDVADTDVRATGEPRFDAVSARHQHGLEAALDRHRYRDGTLRGDLTAFVQAMDPSITADPTWRAVQVRLDALARAGVDVQAAITTALRGPTAGPGSGIGASQSPVRPLPDDLPAAALWWRISRTTDPAALIGRAPGYRPTWLSALAAEIGQRRADRVATDPAWTTLLAAVNHAQRAGIDPDHLITVAAQLTEPARPPSAGGIADVDLARALAVRVAALTHHDPLTFTTHPDRDTNFPSDIPSAVARATIGQACVKRAQHRNSAARGRPSPTSGSPRPARPGR